MDGHQLQYAKWNKSDKEKHLWFHSYVESKNQNKWIKITKQKTGIDTENKQVLARGEESWGEGD